MGHKGPKGHKATRSTFVGGDFNRRISPPGERRTSPGPPRRIPAPPGARDGARIPHQVDESNHGHVAISRRRARRFANNGPRVMVHGAESKTPIPGGYRETTPDHGPDHGGALREIHIARLEITSLDARWPPRGSPPERPPAQGVERSFLVAEGKRHAHTEGPQVAVEWDLEPHRPRGIAHLNIRFRGQRSASSRPSVRHRRCWGTWPWPHRPRCSPTRRPRPIRCRPSF